MAKYHKGQYKPKRKPPWYKRRLHWGSLLIGFGIGSMTWGYISRALAKWWPSLVGATFILVVLLPILIPLVIWLILEFVVGRKIRVR